MTTNVIIPARITNLLEDLDPEYWDGLGLPNVLNGFFMKLILTYHNNINTEGNLIYRHGKRLSLAKWEEGREYGKVMKGLKRTNALILTGYQIYHNCARPIEGLEGMTPEEE